MFVPFHCFGLVLAQAGMYWTALRNLMVENILPRREIAARLDEARNECVPAITGGKPHADVLANPVVI
jgi:hypothetical protein